MTPEVRNQLRLHAADLLDEASRFQRLLARSAADESVVTEHLRNVLKFARMCEVMLSPEPVQYRPKMETRRKGRPDATL